MRENEMDGQLPQPRSTGEQARDLTEKLHALAEDLLPENRPNVEAVRERIVGIALALEIVADGVADEEGKQAVISQAINDLMGSGSPTERCGYALRTLRTAAEGEHVRP